MCARAARNCAPGSRETGRAIRFHSRSARRRADGGHGAFGGGRVRTWPTALRQGLLINCTHDHVLRLLPPFIVSEQQVKDFLKRLAIVLAQTERPAAAVCRRLPRIPRARWRQRGRQ